MGFTMEGCSNDMEKIIGLQRVDDETKSDSIFDTVVKNIWGNFNFDVSVSEAVGGKKIGEGLYSMSMALGLLINSLLQHVLLKSNWKATIILGLIHQRLKVIRAWIANRKKSQMNTAQNIRSKLRDIDIKLDQGDVNEDLLLSPKIKWAVEWDENSKFFHGMVNRKRANLSVKGVMIDGDWIDDPKRVKDEFRDHFAS
nr:RNA-directed DNA polymerase, eukaryota, reverse transcriptase zinc-binding domain protein [Tanacetum cinerariifolium]